MAVYLICLDQHYKHAKHYVGYAEQSVEERLEDHRKNRGSKFLAAVNAAGITYSIVRVWQDGDRKFERKIKNTKSVKNYCPVCRNKKRQG